MKALNHPFELTPEQRKQGAKYNLVVVAALFLFMLIVAATGTDAVMLVVEAALGVAVGLAVRRGTQRGWMLYAAKYPPGATYVFTRNLKLGVLWRALATWLGGCVVLEFLTAMASSDLAIAFEFFIGASITVSAAQRFGLRFGWRSADSLLTRTAPATATP